MKKYLSIFIFPLASILILPILMSILNIFNISLNKIIITLIMIIIMLISGVILGKHIQEKGYLKGFMYGASISLVMFILSLILLSEHSIYSIIYYLIITAATTLGTMIGINKKE